MAKQFLLTLLTPDKEFFSEPVEQVIFDTPEGRLGVMAGHVSMIAAVAEGIVEIQADGRWRTAAAGRGFAEVGADKAEFFVDTAEWAEDIDTARANLALQRADARLKGKLSHVEYLRAQAAMARAIARIKAAEKKGKFSDRE